MSDGQGLVQEIPAEQSASEMLHSDDATWMKVLNLTDADMVEGDDDAPAHVPDQEAAPDTEAPDSPLVPDEDVVEGEPEAEAEPAAEAAKDPEAEKEPEPAVEKPKPITDFVVYDAEGAVEIPALELEFKANGQTRKMPLDKVVRLAQSGFYNEELQEQVREFREKEPVLAQRVEEAEALARRQAALIQEVMTDEEKYLARREQFQQAQSPEARAARAEARLRETEQRVMQIESQRSIDAFLSSVGPRVDALVAEHPTVSEEEAAGWLAPQLKRLERHGVIPPERLRDVERLVTEDLAIWLGQRHESRTAKQAQEAETRKLSLRKVQVEAAKAKQQAARAVAPTRTATSGATSPREPTKPPASAREAADEFFRREMGG